MLYTDIGYFRIVLCFLSFFFLFFTLVLSHVCPMKDTFNCRNYRRNRVWLSKDGVNKAYEHEMEPFWFSDTIILGIPVFFRYFLLGISEMEPFKFSDTIIPKNTKTLKMMVYRGIKTLKMMVF